MAQLPDHYATLGVRPDADTAAIRRAWIRAARANHPDRRGDVTEAQSERSDSRMRSVNEAWRVLGSADSRRSYDEERAAAAPRPPEPSPAASPVPRAAAGGASHDEPSDPWFDDGATTVEPGGPGGFVVRHRSAALVVRVLPWLAIAVVGLVIFVASAYMTADTNPDPSRVAALEVGECFGLIPMARCSRSRAIGRKPTVCLMRSSQRPPATAAVILMLPLTRPRSLAAASAWCP